MTIGHFIFGFLSFVLAQCIAIVIGARIRIRMKYPWTNPLWLSKQFLQGILILAIIVIAQGTIMFVFGDVPFSARVINVFFIATLLGFIVGFVIGIKEVRR
jgi:hypothetical protein